MKNIGVIGYGYWGPNVVRNLMSIHETNVVILCDSNPEALDRAKEYYPYLEMTQSEDDIFHSPQIDAVAIVTPVSTHYKLARQALENNKNIFIEKPFTQTSKEAEELIQIAEQKGLIIMVDHTFLFTGAVRKIKEIIDENTLGALYYYDATRVSLGLFQQDVNVIWDLAPHDFSIINYIIQNKPVALAAHGRDHTGSGQENIAYITVFFENSLIVHINVNWLSPVKIRTTLIGGEKKMLVWDDLQSDEKIKIYDRGVSVENKEGLYRLLVDYRAGDMWAPRLDHAEALKRELQYFAQCLEKGEKPFNDGVSGLQVVKMLEATTESLHAKGALIKL
ncbi:MAG: Gfo/Idh/MocA family oxidoreductase [Candidatus Omnitrophica bacterium]|nr:Gfo/Idh/MocA family oxidoreductase [Candidatus Omnitrophota bacterium]